MKKLLLLLVILFTVGLFSQSTVGGFIEIDATGNVNINGAFTAGSGSCSQNITATLHVSPDGDGTDGKIWSTAYQTIQAALDAASTDANDLTLILIAPHATFYDINTTGDPTWIGNYEIAGTHRIWSAVRNEHASATSVFKFTGKVSITNLAIFTNSTNNANGVIFTASGWRVRKCGFNSSGTDGANTSVYIDGSAALTRGGIMSDVQFIGHVTHTKAIHINQSTVNEFRNVTMHTCLTGIQIVDADSDYNQLTNVNIGDCALAIDLDGGNEQHFFNIQLHNNTLNVDDDSADNDHVWSGINGEFDMDTLPDDLTGVSVTASATALLWGANVEVRAAATSTKPFKIVGYIFEPAVTQKHKVRFTADDSLSFFDEVFVEQRRNSGSDASSDTDHIFNVGTQIKAGVKAESDGSDAVKIWLKIQEI